MISVHWLIAKYGLRNTFGRRKYFSYSAGVWILQRCTWDEETGAFDFSHFEKHKMQQLSGFNKYPGRIKFCKSLTSSKDQKTERDIFWDREGELSGENLRSPSKMSTKNFVDRTETDNFRLTGLVTLYYVKQRCLPRSGIFLFSRQLFY